ncbi:serine/threonine-protein kinase [Streptosporangium roseum]|uniref:non-specific serine/threonine protein kinase n=1 Tax=Streptosporangium roseum (strain ATCC 12428 / DSM 43021 / JCM 3005 / KCTC 9067 / NCIMB 10171 / NRRL 2505 / NI 9100) TaxID=479432 RepID=D2B854_STRRD|nr:serine/threonine-protein kinase [Streptosporangium roseum]ACZ85844.1 Serine/threonine protein kinase-like protein [Streptosporangium roseum DSM 43021]
MTERKVAGRYRLLEPIGEGGMGVVWRAHDELLDRVVAVKEVRHRGIDEAARTEMNRRTIREARTAGRLDHPSVIIVHDVVEEEGRPWIVMQMVRSRSLGEVVRADGPLPPERVASVGLQVLGALLAAHAAGVLHRDVKPENVLLADDGRVVLTDFGIASMTQETAITRTGGMVGTPAFLPPERLHGLAATPESDLWSLGATLYAALEGRAPFERATAAATMMAVLHGEPSPMTHTGPLADAVLGLMTKDPAIRMTAEQATALLSRAAHGQVPGRYDPAGMAGPAAPPPHPGTATRHTQPPHPGAPAGHDGSPYAARQPHAGQPPYPSEASSYQAGAAPGGWQPQHAGQPSHPGPAQPSYGDSPAHFGQPSYRNSPTHAGQPPHQDGAAHFGQPSHPGDPAQRPYGDSPAHFGQSPPDDPAHPRWPHQGQPTDAGRLAPPARRSGTGRVALAVGVPALVVAVGVGGWLVLREGDGTPSPSPTTTAVVTGGPAASATPSRTPQATRTPSARPTTAIPAGWRLHRDPMGFTVAVPRGWAVKRFSGRDRVEFRPPGKNGFLWIESTEDPETDPVKHWEKVERGGLKQNIWPGYERISITALRYRGLPAADWEFTYLRDKVRMRVLDRGFRTLTGRPYAIYWESPDDGRSNRTFFDRFTETFRP